MHKVLIVDDEPMIREGLQTLVDWSKYGFEVAGTASNGQEAVQRHRELRPQLLLIDIRMPKMDGLKAIEAIREFDESCHILILSGYADFNYAKQAIGFGVDGYVLKPIDENELESFVERISTSLSNQAFPASRQDPRAAALLREELLQQLLEERLEHDGLTEEQTALWFQGRLWPSRLLLIELYSREHSLTMKNVVRKRLDELVCVKEAGWTFAAEPYIGILLKDLPELRGGAEQLKDWLAKACEGKARFTAMLSRTVKDIDELSAEIPIMKTGLKRRFMLEGDKIYSTSMILDMTSALRSSEPRLESVLIEELAHKLFYMADIGSKDGLIKTLDEASARLAEASDNEQQLKGNWAQLLTIMLNKAAAAHQQLKLKEDLAMITGLYLKHHYNEMLDQLRTQLIDLTEKMGASDQTSVMKRIFDFIDRHYDESIRLETLAELFNYNSGYLGKLFKSHAGESFNTYLDKVRIAKSIELLQQGHKVHQVAELVGYANADYFHSKFKKYKGISPSAFKQSGGK
ncbi:response regulator [Paenibacillus sp. HB172176]|uniref:response regulator transcription factor n=1 Tax=Paenibacillus sp. HB172176 TaxID=2493690 RepID=UPI00143B7611|nr:response regulator [Paenibacillus sp. HB172176]